jgi:hypothetical protein
LTAPIAEVDATEVGALTETKMKKKERKEYFFRIFLELFRLGEKKGQGNIQDKKVAM